MAPKAKKEAASTGAVQIGIEYKKDVDFPKWYQQVWVIRPSLLLKKLLRKLVFVFTGVYEAS